MSETTLAAECACGHTANYHLSGEQQAARRRGTNGRYSGECTGGTHAHCRCITSREEVIAATQVPHPAADPSEGGGGRG